jgi:hypothetical protein
MAKSLKDKVAEALKEAVGDGARIELEDVPGDKVGGLVLSSSFANQSASERQDHIWKYLDSHLAPSSTSCVNPARPSDHGLAQPGTRPLV